MRSEKKQYSVRLDLQKYDFPDVPSESCYVELLIDPSERVKDGDLCYAPRLNQVMRLKKPLPRIAVHKVLSVNCPPALAVKRLPDFLFMKRELIDLICPLQPIS
ncbi:MAG: hypothetical protein C4532_17610 [Candidatus Abyssobacteria bacterium SURF_17]|jgi:hypothetical protein|uniref:Uncharacterized protein n=1 Tax=Candidatus Abyssobacteria bacterium SURF_17 TaxID=2093361 RepID=A0A419EQH8_9BACT|nr:MAG: hypothetical protein C4532_17610 [Candidatus Abyssubacteria bacterium SURF_17]